MLGRKGGLGRVVSGDDGENLIRVEGEAARR
jgi:hypothetical protein